MNWMAVSWFCLMVVFLAMESSTVSLVSIWFAAGSLVAMVTAVFGGKLWLQILLFALVSVVLLASLRSVVRKFITPKLTKTNVDAVAGSTGFVVEAIDNVRAQGRVKLGGMEWSARSTENIAIEEGTLVNVDRVEGVKVFVSRVDT